MAASLTITAKVGPDIQVTALEFDELVSLEFAYTHGHIKDGVIEVTYMKDNDVKIQYFDMSTVLTVTYVIAGTTHTITIA